MPLNDSMTPMSRAVPVAQTAKITTYAGKRKAALSFGEGDGNGAKSTRDRPQKPKSGGGEDDNDGAGDKQREEVQNPIPGNRWSQEEDELLIVAVEELGKNWPAVEKRLVGRTHGMCRNRYQRLFPSEEKVKRKRSGSTTASASASRAASRASSRADSPPRPSSLHDAAAAVEAAPFPDSPDLALKPDHPLLPAASAPGVACCLPSRAPSAASHQEAAAHKRIRIVMGARAFSRGPSDATAEEATAEEATAEEATAEEATAVEAMDDEAVEDMKEQRGSGTAIETEVQQVQGYAASTAGKLRPSSHAPRARLVDMLSESLGDPSAAAHGVLSTPSPRRLAASFATSFGSSALAPLTAAISKVSTPSSSNAAPRKQATAAAAPKQAAAVAAASSTAAANQGKSKASAEGKAATLVSWRPDEDEVLLRAKEQHGNKWKQISALLPGAHAHAASAFPPCGLPIDM